MNKADYEKALSAAKTEIDQLLEQRTQIDNRITQLKFTTEALSKLLGIDIWAKAARLAEFINQVPADPGITNAIRQVLASSKIPMNPTEIKLGLESIGFDLSEYANSGAVIHNTLARLERQGEVARVQNPAGQTVAYALIGQRKTLKQRGLEAGGVPNPFGKNLTEMLKESPGKEK
jgi:hypothetical protein